MSLTIPTYQVEVSFTDIFDTPDWVDITRWVKKGSTKRGRQHELQRAIAGTCALTITNQDGRFSTFNTSSPYVNFMTAADSYFQDQTIGSAPGTWGNTTNCALSLVANLGYDGYAAMSLTASSAATMSASTATGTSGYAVTAGNVYGFQAQFETAVTARTCKVGVGWYNSGGSLIGSVTYGTGVTDGTSSYTKATLTATAPAGATTAALFAQVTTPANTEVHYVTRCMISNADSFGNVSTAWAPGGRGLVPARPVKVLATWSATQYPVFYGYVDSWLPSYGVALSDQVLNCSDGLTVLALSFITSSGYKAQIIADGAIGYWRLGETSPSPGFADSSGNGNSLTLFSAAASAVCGVTGALVSDANAAVSLSISGASLNATTALSSTGATFNSAGSAWSIECWAKMGAPPPNADAQIMSLSSGSFNLSVDALFTLGSAQIASGTLGSGPFSSSVNIADGNYHHIVGTVTAAGTYTLFVDGVSALSGSSGAPPSSLTSVTVGPTFSIVGPVTADEAAIYPSALSASTVALHYSLGLHGFVQQQSGQRVAAVLTALGVPSALQSLATGISAVQAPTATLTTTPALSHIQTVENTEQGFFYVDESGNYTYRDRHYIIQNTAAVTSNATFSNDANGAHYKYLPGIVPAEDALDLWNDAPVSAIANAGIGVTGAIQDAPNADSKKWYGVRTLQGYSSMLQTTDAEALYLSQWLIAHYGLPIPRVRSMKLDSTVSSPSSLPQMLGRKLLDRITVKWQPIDGTTVAFSQDSLIENIAHDFGPDLWTTTWGLSVAETQNYFTLNDATRGTLAATGALTGNRLAF